MKNDYTFSYIPLCVLVLGSLWARGEDFHKLVGSGSLTDPAMYENNAVPGPADRIVWKPSNGNETITLGGPLSIAGIYATNLYHTTTISSENSLTMGAEGLHKVGKSKFTLDVPVFLDADQTWYNSTEDIIFAKPLSFQGHTLTLSGANRRSSTTLTGPGSLILEGGSLNFYNGGTLDSEITVRIERNASITFDKNDGKIVTPNPRAYDLTLSGAGHYDGAAISVESLNKQSKTDTIGKVTVEPGHAFIRVNVSKPYFLGLQVAELECLPGAFLLFRGKNLGLYPIASEALDAGNLWFETTPELIGGSNPSDPTSLPLIPNALAATNTTDYGSTFATYSAENGVRPLDMETEYAMALPDGEETSQNVRLIDNGDGAVKNIALAAPLTTINSLLLDDTGLGGGLLVNSETPTTLRVLSGLVYSRQMASTVVANDAHTLGENVSLDFNGREGCIISRQTQQKEMSSNAPFYLRSAIVNDGGEGVTFASVQNRGLIYWYGNPGNAYTGPTRLVNGNLNLYKGLSPDCTVLSVLEIYGGSCMNTGGTIADTADIKLLGGSLRQKGAPANSGSGASDIFRDLYILHPNSSMVSGASGTSSGSTTLRNAYVGDGKWSTTRGHKVTLEALSLFGGTLTIDKDESASRTSIFTIQNGLVITNTLAGEYVPITMGNGENEQKVGGLLRLAGGLTFAGNETNFHSTIISNAPPVANSQWARFQLEGVQDFDIGDGAADIDLRIEPWLQDASSELLGGIRKVGAGTLALVHTNNAYTAGTFVEEGRLVADGRLAGDVSVSAGAVFQGGLLSDTGAVEIGGDLVLANGAHLATQMRADGTGTLTQVDGRVCSEGITLVDVDDEEGVDFEEERVFLTASAIEGKFMASNPKLSVGPRSHGTELVVQLASGTILFFR